MSVCRRRDLDDIDLALQFDPLTSTWQSLGELGAAHIRETETETLDVLADLGKAQPHTVARTLGKDYVNTRKRVAALWTAGRIKKDVIEGKTFYFLPEERKIRKCLPCLPALPSTLKKGRRVGRY